MVARTFQKGRGLDYFKRTRGTHRPGNVIPPTCVPEIILSVFSVLAVLNTMCSGFGRVQKIKTMGCARVITEPKSQCVTFPPSHNISAIATPLHLVIFILTFPQMYMTQRPDL
jgi:hypothetical protein